MKRVITELVVYSGPTPVESEDATYIRLEDDGGGCFLEVTQPHMVDFINKNNPCTIRLDFGELDNIIDALQAMRAQADMAGLVK